MQNNKKAIKLKNIDRLAWMATSPNQELATIFGNFCVVFWQCLPVKFIVLHLYFYPKLSDFQVCHKLAPRGGISASL